MMQISFGMLGLMGYWLRGSFGTATGFGYSAISFVGHLYDALAHGNTSSGNIGLSVWIDLTIGCVIIVLLRRRPPRE